MKSLRASSSSFLMLGCVGVLAICVLAAAEAEGSRVLGDASAILAETDAERWTDISVKKLETQQAAHDEEFKVDWKGLDQIQTREQKRLNNVHAVREHPADVHAAHFEKSVPEVDFRDAKVQDINLGGVQTPEARSSAASVLTVVGLGFVVFIAIIGVIRYRATRNHAAGSDAANANMGGDDYHWVDELNIIVNPMEEQGSNGNDEDQELPLRDDFSEDSEMSDREMDLEQGDLEDISSEEEDEMPGVTIATAAGVKELRSCRGLEWDDSTI